MGGTSPNVDNMEIKSISIYLGAQTGNVRLAVYTGGALDNPTAATLLWDAGTVNPNGTAGWYTISHPSGGVSWPKNTVTWLAWKRNTGVAVYYSTSSASAGNFQTARGRNSNTFNQSPTVAFPSTYGQTGTFANNWHSIYVTYDIAPPVANFTGTPLTGTAPLAVTFTDTSTGTVTSWSWNFGDGVGTSNLQNPTYTYNNPGTYTVTLTATGPGGSDGETKTNYITVSAAAPVANFTGTPLSGVAPLLVTFTDTSTNATSWSWNFGDGVGTSNLQNPTYTYNTPGTYTVTLTATGPGGSDQEIKTNYISVYEPLVANFSGTPTTGYKPLTAQFTDSSTGVVTAWSWNFGDGGISTEQNPSYTYNNLGTYTVTLTVTGPGGSDAETKVGYITVNGANFTGYPTSGNKPLSVKFTDASAGATSWLWDFGDGGTSTIQSPGHTYTVVGTFTVTLTVTGPGGSDTRIRADYINVSGVPPVANFSANPTSGIKPLTVQFSDESTNIINSWLWDFGDGSTSTAQNPYHTYSSLGIFTVTLTVTGPDGSDTMQMVDYIHATDIVVDRSTGNVSRPQIAADGIGHVYAVWEDTRNGSSDIYFNSSSDYGFTWQASDIRLDTDAAGANHSNSPQITCDNNGHVYVVWEDERNGSSDIYFNYSSNYGVTLTWQSSDKKLSSASYAPPPQFPKVACDNSGHVYVAWDDNYFNVSADNGATWLTQASRISTAGGIENQLACDQNGHVYVAWRKGTSEVLFNYSLDGGNTWQPIDRRISNAGAIPYGLSLTSDENGHVYCVWHDGRNNATSPDIYFNSSSDYGNTWGASDIMLNTGTPGNTYSIWPEVTCDETGHVFVAWYDRRDGLGDIYLNFSSDYGLIWQVSDKRLDTDSPSADSGYPEVASDGSGHIYVTWTDDQTDIGPGLYLNYSLDNGANWLSANRKIGSGGFSPQMVTDASRFYIIRDDNNDIVFNEVAPLQVPPFAPADPSPISGAAQISLMPVLSWRSGDANLDDTLTYDIYFGTLSPPPLVLPNQSETTYLPGTLTNLTTYYWQVVARDQSGAETAGPIWSFTTISGPPQFVSFSPPDGATGVLLTSTLSWTAVDDPGDTITYDVYFGTTNPPPRQITNYTLTTYMPGLLTHATLYYWKVVARDNHGTQTIGPVLSFTTINNPPQFTTYSPSNGATGIALNRTLTWSASDPELDPLTYDIYFGTSSPPPLVISNQTTASYAPGQLSHATIYYWKVVARDSYGAETELPILSFTTLNNAPQFLTFSPPHMSTGVSLTPTLSWSVRDPNGDPLTYDIYFGTSTSPPLILSNQTAASYEPGQPVQLSSLTRYYWKIVARDSYGAETAIPVMYFTTKSQSPQLSNFLPVDGATGIDLAPTLSWSATDPDPGDTITFAVYFGTSPSPPQVTSSQTATTYKPSGLSALTTYYWKIVATDNHGDKTESPIILSFTTANRPPQFQGFLPPDFSTGISTNPKLSWAASDPDPGDTITYDVYLGTSSPPPLIGSNQTATNYFPIGLLGVTSYYWKVVARDNHGAETVGTEQMFTTGPVAPYISSISPSPCPTSQVFSITGGHFGDTQGSSVLVFEKNGKKWVFRSGSPNIKVWSDTRIDFQVPDFPAQPSGWTSTFRLAVRVNGIYTNIVQLRITKP